MQQKNSKLFLLLFLGTLSGFGPFVTDLYLPSLPTLSKYFNVSTSLTQMTLTGGMIGLALGQLIIGPISDKYGRKISLIISLIIFLLSTLVIILVPNIYMMIIFRFIQGSSAAGALVISRAVSTDLYQGEEMRKFFGLLMVINGIAPIISPVMGSFLLGIGNWQAIFVILGVIGFILLMICFRFKESLKIENRKRGSIIDTYLNVFQVLKNKKFTLLVLIQAFSMGALFGYISASPFILQTHYGLSTFLYSLCFGANGLAIVIGNYLSSNLNERNSLTIGTSLMLLASIILFFILTMNLSVFLVEILFFLLLLGFGFILASAASLAMDSERNQAGSASAMIGFFPFFFGGVVSPLVGIGNIFYSTSITIFLCSLVTYILFLIVKKIF
ncbi:multidrug effflux MFS transporter [Fusobacterium simiae]|uniref:multidrug effflux MFS transporter n=1 Tax=Fusobacterium TaxID=848 RepID=UPI0018972A5F|nr:MULTISPECIES: multidrug effflux MFS transporter [Fusobacterium]MDC7955520.1 multidrug effflux MFS transporter [Fusobacterium simiae]